MKINKINFLHEFGYQNLKQRRLSLFTVSSPDKSHMYVCKDYQTILI